MEETAKYAEVLVDVANRRLDRSYHYLIPEGMTVKAGMTLLVPLRQRAVQGLVVQITDILPEEVKQSMLKPIERIIHQDALIPGELMELACWMAKTTVSSVAQCLHTVWPFLRGKVEDFIIPRAGLEDGDVEVMKLLDPDSYKVLAALNRARKGGLPENILLKRTGVTQELINELLQQGWIGKTSRLSGEKRLRGTIQVPGSENRLKETVSEFPPVSAGGGQTVRLTGEQEEVLDSIWKTYEKKEKNTVLLHGVTGSGKTEIYKALTERVLKQGGDVIVLVPEISLTSQIAASFLCLFEDKLSVVHSGLKPAEKEKIWSDILAGRKRVVIGARSAVFAPLPNLRLIILDEEHDSAYKQDENPKYHTRDVARYRIEQSGGLVLLGSATPSLEAYAAAHRGKIELLALRGRYNQMEMPLVRTVDMKEELAQGNTSIFSNLLIRKLRERVDKKEQSILFLNRRGYATFVFCRECGNVARCPNCDVSLTYHSQTGELCCHYCNYRTEVYSKCPECGSKFIRFFGQGTQKVEEEAAVFLPGVPIFRLDADATAAPQKHREIIEEFRRTKPAVLVGTQMLAKGLDFPDVTLVGVIAADQILNMPDFRSRERAFQLLTQVAGRAGRREKPGEVVIQTYSPDDRSILHAARHDYPSFFWEEIAFRKERAYPPFAHILRILLYHEKEDKVARAAGELAVCLKNEQEMLKAESYQILGPAPSVLTKLKNEYRWQVSIKGKDPEILREMAYKGVKKFFEAGLSSGIKISIDVNPVSP